MKHKLIGHRYLLPVLFVLAIVLTNCWNAGLQKSSTQLVDYQQDKPLTIWWNKGHSLQEDEAIEQVVQAWEQQSGIKAELTLYSEEDLIARIQQALEAGNPPDVVFNHRLDETLAPLWAWEGKLADVSDVVKLLEKDYSQSVLESIRYYNQKTKRRSYYGVPIKQNTLHFHYWRSLLKEIGLTDQDIPQEWDAFWEFWQQAQTKLRRRGYPDIYGVGLSMSTRANDSFYAFEQALEAYDVKILDQQGRLRVDEPQVRQGLIETLDWFTSFYTEGYTPPNAINWVGADNNINFLNQNILMTLNTTLSIPGSQSNDSDIYLNQIATGELPRKPDGESMTYPVAIKQALIFASAHHPSTAKDFLAYLVAPQQLSDYLKGNAGRYFPVMPELWSDPFWQNQLDPHITAARKQFQEGSTRPLYQSLNIAYSQVESESVWGAAIKHIVVDGWSPEKAADFAITKIKQIFAQWES